MQTSKISTLVEHKQQKPQEKKQQKQQQPQTLILRLQNKPVPRVSWTNDTIDNQHMNKKKSNLCCIYHRPGESSSDTCTSDDEGNALQRDKHTKHLHKKVCSKRKNNKKQENKNDKCCGDKGKHSHSTHGEKKFLED